MGEREKRRKGEKGKRGIEAGGKKQDETRRNGEKERRRRGEEEKRRQETGNRKQGEKGIASPPAGGPGFTVLDFGHWCL